MACNTEIGVDDVFTFTWSIENFSYCFKKNKASLGSPLFRNERLSSGTWQIGLYPRGVEEKPDDIACYLYYRSDVDNEVAIKFRLGILGDPEILIERLIEHKFVSNADGYGFPSLISRKQLFQNKDLYLPNDTLMIQCQIREDENKELACNLAKRVFFENSTKAAKIPKLDLLDEEIGSLVSELKFEKKYEPIGCSARSCISVHRAKFEYSGGLECNKFASVIIKSPSLLLSLKMVDSEKKQILIRIRRMEISYSESAFASCNLRLTDSFKEINLEEKFDFFFNDVASVWEIYLDTTSVKFEDDNVHIKFEYRASTGRVKHDILHWDYKTMSPVSIWPHRKIESGEMSEFYLNQKHCDLKLVCADGQELHAHKLILSVGSAIFKAMFDHDTKENRENTVTIDDLSSKTMDLLLGYLYSGKYPDLKWTDVLQLHVAADKYQVSKLADHCVSLLRNQLAVGNVCEILLQSDRRHVVELKSAAMKFACLNLTEVFQSEGWKCLYSTDSELAAEFLKYVSEEIGQHSRSTKGA